jgi:hypothetical protein
MATIRKRITHSGTKYQVQIRKIGHKAVSRSFNSLKDAQTFAKDIEVKIERSVYQCAKDAESYLFGELAKRYLDEVLVFKKGYHTEKYNIRPVIRYFKDYKLINVRPHVVAGFKKHRLDEVSPGTVSESLVCYQEYSSLLKRNLVSTYRKVTLSLKLRNQLNSLEIADQHKKS